MKTIATALSTILFLLSVTLSIVSTTADGAYAVAPSTKHEIPYKVSEKETPKPIAVQGLIYCKSGSKLIPLKGATARVTCLAKNHNGLELAPFSVSSCPADDKGYFLAKLSPPSTNYVKKAKWELKDCKVFLEKSPMEQCKVPLDINGGIKGAHIISTSSYRLLKNANMYSIEPFFYASDEPKLVSHKKGY
ncbi:protein SEED AND ROOT HAIR PROTECTIVE PROTEIN-like [Rutidosis leptorrhynchoides]|uniref:protein SEED AND ROOT HAIR PROTECTIVE PROTEIN-like n=1 Tax=Rutidosis leptorrhynchoides TaxID=125765 RepID=UPI003A99442D